MLNPNPRETLSAFRAASVPPCPRAAPKVPRSKDDGLTELIRHAEKLVAESKLFLKQLRV